MSRELVVLGPGDTAAVVARRASAFGSDPDDGEALEGYRRFLEAGQVVGLAEDGQVVAQCRRRVAAHAFGGRWVDAQHIASVAVAPEHRGHGAASELMRRLVAEGAGQGLGLSLLFPAANLLYRRLGWEHAGLYQRYQLDARRAPALGVRMRRADRDTDWPAIRDCYRRAARRTAGAMCRPEEEWDGHAEARYRYVLDGAAPGTVDAYLLVDHRREPGDWQYVLDLRDWAATTPEGLRAVVGFVGVHGTLAKAATFTAPVPCPWAVLLPEQDLQPAGGMAWMARGLDLPAAVAQRGFPAGLAARVTFAVEDPLLPAARGPWRLEVVDGTGTLEPAPGADVRMDARGFGPLFTGHADPWTLRTAGLLTGPDDALAVLAAAFAGPQPCLTDFF